MCLQVQQEFICRISKTHKNTQKPMIVVLLSRYCVALYDDKLRSFLVFSKVKHSLTLPSGERIFCHEIFAILCLVILNKCHFSSKHTGLAEFYFQTLHFQDMLIKSTRYVEVIIKDAAHHSVSQKVDNI